MPEGKWDCLQQTAVLSGFRQFYKAMLIYNSQDISSCKLHFWHPKRGAAKSELLNSRSSAPRSPRRLLFRGGALGIPETFLLLIHFPWLRESTASIRPYSQIELKSFGNTNKATTSWPCSVLNFCFIGWNTQARKFSLCYALCTREWELCWEMTSAQGSHPFIWSWDRVTWPLLTHPLEDAPVCFGNEWVNKQLFTFFSSVA